MITIPVQLSNELARRVLPLQDRLPEIIELGLRQIKLDKQAEASYAQSKQQVLDAMAATGIVTLPQAAAQRHPRASHADCGRRTTGQRIDHRRAPRGAMSQPVGQAVTSYLDSSALVKRYLVETGTPWVQTWCADPIQTVAVAEIGLVEIAAAFAGKLRGAHITPAQYDNARTDLAADAHDAYVLVTINRAVVDEAIELTAQYRLRGYDAVHLACALTLDRALTAYRLPSLVFISADDDLMKAATAEGLATDNPNLHP